MAFDPEALARSKVILAEEEASQYGEWVVLHIAFPKNRKMVLKRRIGESILIIKRYLQDNFEIPYSSLSLHYDSEHLLDPMSLNDYPNMWKDGKFAAKVFAKIDDSYDLPDDFGEPDVPNSLPLLSPPRKLAPLITASATSPLPSVSNGTSSTAGATSVPIQSASAVVAPKAAKEAVASTPVAVAKVKLDGHEVPDYVAKRYGKTLPKRMDDAWHTELAHYLRPVTMNITCDAALVTHVTSTTSEVESARTSGRSCVFTTERDSGETIGNTKLAVASYLGVSERCIQLWANETLLLDPLSLNDIPELKSDGAVSVTAKFSPVAAVDSSETAESKACTLL